MSVSDLLARLWKKENGSLDIAAKERKLEELKKRTLAFERRSDVILRSRRVDK